MRYSDIISDVQKIEVNSRVWYYQQFNRWDGNLKAVNLYDEDGEYVCEFSDMESMIDFIMRAE